MTVPQNRGPRIEGRLTLELREPGGPVLLRRHARNAVLRGGAELLADLFRGAVATPINGAMVGVGDEPPNPPYESGPTVTGPGDTPRLLRPTAPIAPADLTVETIADEFRVRLTARALLPAANAVDPEDSAARVEITEASLGVLAADGLSLARLYNRVVFDPVPKTDAHEIALYFEVDFPYGA
ncbi:hypothetical protein LPC08_12690 [Roseomonas sp. OT10]|uniref:hypothetical protein n=1 Tax=Roseomonas cutis TaxID=2897332 RepID=UPI001E306651|nr:hypothetical protein [Roseomonas sp. OT10]UFN46887.1 hypothetical protein LPC08_12690 [Roseomonas sp. OT10]